MPTSQNATNTLQLRDIHLPASPDIWPPAPGWWLVATLLLFVIGWGLYKYLVYRYRQREIQAMIKKLQPIEQRLLKKPDNETLAELNILLRRLALMHYPREQIASLNGKNWLEFLDQSGHTNRFSQDIGQVLADAPYRSNTVNALTIKEAKELLELVKKWVAKTVTKVPNYSGAIK